VAGGITDLDGHPFLLSLVSPSYAIAFDASAYHSQGDQTFLTARFAPNPAWLVANGFALQVGDAPGSPGFEAETLKGNVTSVRCQPALLLAAAPMSATAGETVAAQPLPLANALRWARPPLPRWSPRRRRRSVRASCGPPRGSPAPCAGRIA
jgi:hypothetical protein